MKKVITEVIVSVAVLDNEGSPVRAEGSEWTTADEVSALSQEQLRDAVDYLWQYLDVPPLRQTVKEEKKAT